MKEWIYKNWAVVLLIICIGVIGYVLGRNKTPDYSLYQYKYEQAQDSIKIVKKIIDSLTNSIQYDENKEVNRLDSLLQSSIEANEKTIYALKHQKSNINTDILSAADLQRYFSKIGQ